MDFASIYLSLVTVTLCLIALIIFALGKDCFVKYRLRHVKGPKGLPLFGNALQVGKDNTAERLMKSKLWSNYIVHTNRKLDNFHVASRTMEDEIVGSFMKKMDVWAKEFLDAGCYVMYLGTKPFLVIYNADDMETILRNTKKDKKAFTYHFLEDWLGNGLLLSDGPKWAFRRKLLTPSFHFSMLANFLDVINEHAKGLLDNMYSLVGEPEIELQGIISFCSLDILNECMMGQKLGAQHGGGKRYIKAIRRIGDIFMMRLQSPWLWGDTLFRWSKLGKEHARVVKTLHEMTKKVIYDRKVEVQTMSNRVIDDKTQKARKRRNLALLDLLIEAQKQDNTLTDEGKQEEVDTFMFEGHDTVSTSTTIAMYLIGRHPEVQRKIQKELDDVFGNDRERPVTMDDLQKLEYLGCVMKEAQRFLSTVPIVARDLVDDIRVCGTVVPKGTTIYLGFYWLHHDPSHFPDPQTFDPDRFLPANSEGRHPFAYLPFSAGHRNCIGQKFAIMEQKVMMATVLRNIEVTSLRTKEELKLSSEIVLRATAGVHVKLNLRK